MSETRDPEFLEWAKANRLFETSYGLSSEWSSLPVVEKAWQDAQVKWIKAKAEQKALVRELDVLLHGADAAEQASLCDLVSMVAARTSQPELPQFEDPTVQAIYQILADDEAPPEGHHWEGFAAQKIVAALRGTPSELPAPSAEVISTSFFGFGIRWLEKGGKRNIPPVGTLLYTFAKLQQGPSQDAYDGAREDLSIWKRRALEAERDLRAVRAAAPVIEKIKESFSSGFVTVPSGLGRDDRREAMHQAAAENYHQPDCPPASGEYEALERVHMGCAHCKTGIYHPEVTQATAGTPQSLHQKEPTESMLNAARDWSVKKYGIGIGNEAAIGAWGAMYEAFAKQERVGRADSEYEIRMEAYDLLQRAEAIGLTVTVELIPKAGLAMGNTAPYVRIRKSHATYRAEQAAEAAKAAREAQMLPAMTDPLGKHWRQAKDLRDRVTLYDTHAAIGESDWQSLSNYETSSPSGVYAGKVWRRGPLLCWYGEVNDGKCRIHHLRALVQTNQQRADAQKVESWNL